MPRESIPGSRLAVALGLAPSGFVPATTGAYFAKISPVADTRSCVVEQANPFTWTDAQRIHIGVPIETRMVPLRGFHSNTSAALLIPALRRNTVSAVKAG
jgi:hypothetical protein